MSFWLVVLTGLIYLYIALEQVTKGNWPVGVTFFGYFLGNVGMCMVVK